jgi:hypothetical protein
MKKTPLSRHDRYDSIISQIALASGLVNNRIDSEDSNLFTPSDIAVIQRPGSLVRVKLEDSLKNKL